MASLAEYFEKNRPQPHFEFATRVFGKYNKIPFIGTVYGDGMVSEEQGPRLSIHLDLPMMIDGKIKTIIVDTYDKFKGLTLLVYPEDKKAPLSRKVREADSKPVCDGFDSHTARQKKPVAKSRSATLLDNLKKIAK